MKIHSHLRVKHTVQEWYCSCIHVHTHCTCTHVYMYIHTVHVYMYIHTVHVYMYMLTYTYMYYGKHFSQFAHALLHNAWKQTVMMYGMEVHTCIWTWTCTCIREAPSSNWGKHERAPPCVHTYVYMYHTFTIYAMHKYNRPRFTHKCKSTSCKVWRTSTTFLSHSTQVSLLA